MSKEIEKLIKIQGMINKDIFHLSIETNLENNYRWALYLYMPNVENYFSEHNRAILTSFKSSIEELEEYLKKYNGFDRWS